MNVQEIRLPWLWNRTRGQNWAEAQPSDRPIGGLVDYDSSHNRYFVNPARLPWWEWFERELTFRQILQSWPFIQGRVLEIADGKKPFWLFFHHLSSHYASIDFSGLHEACQNWRPHWDPAHLPLKPVSVDTIVVWNVLRFLESPGPFVEQAYTSLKSDGRLILLVSHGSLPAGAAKSLPDFPPEALRGVLTSAGFLVEFERSFWGRGAAFFRNLNTRVGGNALLRKIWSPFSAPFLSVEKAYLDFWQKKNTASPETTPQNRGQKPLASLLIGLKS